jgi:hypothetical protein
VVAHPAAPAVRVVRARVVPADATTVTTGTVTASHVMVTRTARVTRNEVIVRAVGPGPEALVGAVQALGVEMDIDMMSERARWMVQISMTGMRRRTGMRMCVRLCGRLLSSKNCRWNDVLRLFLGPCQFAEVYLTYSIKMILCWPRSRCS